MHYVIIIRQGGLVRSVVITTDEDEARKLQDQGAEVILTSNLRINMDICQ